MNEKNLNIVNSSIDGLFKEVNKLRKDLDDARAEARQKSHELEMVLIREGLHHEKGDGPMFPVGLLRWPVAMICFFNFVMVMKIIAGK